MSAPKAPKLAPDQLVPLELTAKQQTALDALIDHPRPHNEFADEEWTRYVLRFLEARDWNVDQARKLLGEHVDFVKANGVKQLLASFDVPQVITDYCGSGWQGVDLDGYPVQWNSPGLIDIDGMVRSVKKDDYVKARGAYMGETAYRQMALASEAAGRRIDRVNVVLNLKGVGMKSLRRPFYTWAQECLHVFTHHFPQTMRRTLIINAPSAFPMLFNLIKPLLPEHTRRKIVILKNPEQLKLYLPVETIPAMYGGTGPDPGLPSADGSAISRGGEIPKELYLSEALPQEGGEPLSVPRSSSRQVEVEVAQAGTTLKWDFRTESADVGFALYFKEAGSAPGKGKGKASKPSDMECLLDQGRVQSQLVPESGLHRCDKAGTYVLHFDNSFSWVHGKNVTYFLDVQPPVDDDNCDASASAGDKGPPSPASAASVQVASG